MVTCDNNRPIICFIDISECMVASLNLVHQNKLNTIRHKSTVVVVNGINSFNGPFLQEFHRHKDLSKLRDSTESAQNTSHHCYHDRLTINFIDKSECMVVSLNLVH